MMKLFSRNPASKDVPDSPPQSVSPSSSATGCVTGPARPIRLVYCDEKGKFRMDPEAVATLQLLKDPVGVVAVCGRARQGKSFILNQLLGRSSGFHVASTHRPCTKGLWLWSSPLRRTAIDGTEYNLLLLDSEGIDAYDQTGTYSTQIFSLAVLLSSMFIYNQMGGIDEAALDRLSLVTQMTKHIRVRASGGRSSATELGQFSPVFVWLLRDFYLDLVEDNRRITPRDYLELALRPVQGGGKDVSSKNDVRDSIRALFPDRECYTLVRPLNNENDLQRLDQIPLDRLRSEFRAGLDSLTKFVFERTRPKQVGSVVMTGPVLVHIVESYLNALNSGAVPTISSSWQSVEEAECRKAYDTAAEVFMTSFDRTTPPEESALREAYERASQKSSASFNENAVGAGSVRQKFDKLLQIFSRKAFEDYKKTAYMEAELQCSNAVQSMEKKLRTACSAPDADISQIVRTLDGLLSEYRASSSHGPGKWQKLVEFLQRSLEGPVVDLVKKQIDQVGTEKSGLMLRCRSAEDKMSLLQKQLDASEAHKSDYLKRYADIVEDKKRLSDEYALRVANLQSSRCSMEERCSGLSRALESATAESAEWKRKHDQALSRLKAEHESAAAEVSALKSRTSAAEARLDAARQQAEAGSSEASEWRRKYDAAVREAKSALEKAALVQERSAKLSQQREDSLRVEFTELAASKEREITEKAARVESAEQRSAVLGRELKAADAEARKLHAEAASLGRKAEETAERLEASLSRARCVEEEARVLAQEKAHTEQRYRDELARCAELQARCASAERESRRAAESAELGRSESASLAREKNEAEKAASERLVAAERAERVSEGLRRRTADLEEELGRARDAEAAASGRVVVLEGRVEEREAEIQSLLKSNNEERSETVEVLKGLLEAERAGSAQSNRRAAELSRQLQATQGKLDSLQQELTTARLNESGGCRAKRPRAADPDSARETKRTRGATSPSDDPLETPYAAASDEDYTRFTAQKLKQELTRLDFGDELLRIRNPSKKDLLHLYERCISLKKP